MCTALDRVREQPLRRARTGLQLVEEIAVVDDELPDTFSVVDLVHERAVLAARRAGDVVELLDSERDVLERERFDTRVGWNAMNALFAARPEQIQTVRHAEIRHVPPWNGRRGGEVAAVHADWVPGSAHHRAEADVRFVERDPDLRVVGFGMHLSCAGFVPLDAAQYFGLRHLEYEDLLV